jgi:hypothetical protein
VQVGVVVGSVATKRLRSVLDGSAEVASVEGGVGLNSAVEEPSIGTSEVGENPGRRGTGRGAGIGASEGELLNASEDRSWWPDSALRRS